MASDLISTVMDFAYITALRKGDILNLRLDKITDDGIWITQSKTGARQLYEWTNGLHEVGIHSFTNLSWIAKCRAVLAMPPYSSITCQTSFKP